MSYNKLLSQFYYSTAILNNSFYTWTVWNNFKNFNLNIKHLLHNLNELLELYFSFVKKRENTLLLINKVRILTHVQNYFLIFILKLFVMILFVLNITHFLNVDYIFEKILITKSTVKHFLRTSHKNLISKFKYFVNIDRTCVLINLFWCFICQVFLWVLRS